MFRISKQFHFSASHILEGLPEGHKCGRLHGHNYVAELVCEASEVDERGMVFDYGDMKPFGDWIKAAVDHRHINDLIEKNPTAENIAEWFFSKALSLSIPVTRVRVSETPKTLAEFEMGRYEGHS